MSQPRKRKANPDWDIDVPPAKLPRSESGDVPCSGHKPIIKYGKHPQSGVGANFHGLPYPLTLLPYSSWHTLHYSCKIGGGMHDFVCPQCGKRRGAPSAHKRKLFLVAERLSWEDGTLPMRERMQNEELNWEVNYELGILDPVVEDPEQVPGGRQSRGNTWFPYEDEFQMCAAMRLVEKADSLTEVSWRVWRDTLEVLVAPLGERLQDGNEEEMEIETPAVGGCGSLKERNVNIRLSKPGDISASKDPDVIQPILPPTPPSSSPLERLDSLDKPQLLSLPGLQSSPRSISGVSLCRPGAQVTAYQQPIFTHPSNEPDNVISQYDSSSPWSSKGKESPYVTIACDADATNTSTPQLPTPPHRLIYRTLQDFYSLLDKIERTSYVGCKYLEAYAEHLRRDYCTECWLKRYVDEDPSAKEQCERKAPRRKKSRVTRLTAAQSEPEISKGKRAPIQAAIGDKEETKLAKGKAKVEEMMPSAGMIKDECPCPITALSATSLPSSSSPSPFPSVLELPPLRERISTANNSSNARNGKRRRKRDKRRAVWDELPRREAI